MTDASAAPQPALRDAADAISVWQAPQHWRAIDFLSDLHLSAQLPQTLDALCAHLERTDADAVCLLGDVFEVWVGDDACQLPFEQFALSRLRAAAKRLDLRVMAGNRDFLMGPALHDALGATPLPDPVCLHAWEQRVLLTHGDAWCLSDTRYQAFRRQVRDPAWQGEFLSRPLQERLHLAQRMRQASREHQRDASMRSVEGAGDLDDETCRAALKSAGAGVLVHGHTHRPAQHGLGDGLQRWVLSDWDLDAPSPRGDVLRLSADGTLTRHAVAAATRT